MVSEEPVVMMDSSVLHDFLDPAIESYQDIACAVAGVPPEDRQAHGGLFAVLLGTLGDGVADVRRVEFGSNVRATDPVALDEFAENIVPRFGSAYRVKTRGFWLDPAELLAIHRLAEQSDLDILGSIHLHPDWHRIGPPAARVSPLSAAPTPMDRHMFTGAGWPVNLICYVETVGGRVRWTLRGWGGGESCPELVTVMASLAVSPL